MDDRSIERLSVATGGIAVATVGLSSALTVLAGETEVYEGRLGWWWAAYAGYVVAFALAADVVRWRRRPVPTTPLLAVLVVAGCAVVAIAPDLGWSTVLLVVTAATAAFERSLRGALTVLALQTLVVTVVSAATTTSWSEAVLAGAVYGSFQGFAVLVVHGQRREEAARRELAEAHAELRAASAVLATSTRTAERLRISRDLHDVVGHQLTALSLELEVASHHATGAGAEHVERARAVAKDLLRDVRAAVGELRAEPAGIAAPLHDLVDDLPGLAVDLTVEERAPLDEARSLAIVRCVQETVTNALRHSEATRLDISVVVDADGIKLEVADNGRGAATLVPGNGLEGLRERIEALGGRVAMDTDVGRGFAVRAWAPVR